MSLKTKAIIVSALTLVVAMFPSHATTAYLQDRTTVNIQITSNSTPILTGTIPNWCSDVVVGVGTDQSDDYKFFFSDYGQIALSNGVWMLDLSANNYGLINGMYSIFVASECGYSGTYSDPLYADIHLSALSITPASCDTLCVPVYRFYNTQNGAHFYTTNENEKRQVLDMTNYKFEGITTYAKYNRTAPDSMIPVYRFYNIQQGVHFYTANQSEAAHINDTMTSSYRYEGVAYYTYIYPAANTAPVHRFYKFKQGVHFFTSNQTEATTVNNMMGGTYRYEGVSYYNIRNE